jgi:diguanylate cyclase (GGDEF)-like protein
LGDIPYHSVFVISLRLFTCLPHESRNMQDIQPLLDQAEAKRRAGDINGAIAIAEKAFAIAESKADAAKIALVQLDLGNLLRYVPDAVQAIRHLNRAERFYRDTIPTDIRLARALTRQGMVLGDMGDHTRALDMYREALSLIEAIPDADPREEATCYGAIGVACTQLDDFAQAEHAYRRSIPLFEQAGAHESVVFVHNNLAILRVRSIEREISDHSRRGQFADEALQLIDEGFKRNESVQSKLANAALHNTRGDLFVVLGDISQSVKSIREALVAYRQMPLPRGEADTLTNLGEAYLKLGNTDEALTYLREAEAIVARHDLKDHERILAKLLATAYEQQGEHNLALRYFKRYHALELDTHRLDTQKKLQQLAMRAEIDKAMAEAMAERQRANQLDRLAHEDVLTGISNRRRLDEWAADQPATISTGLAVAVMDIDHFKQINDQHSHSTGDAVLRAMGAVLRAHARAGDVVARYGGEEFVVVMLGVEHNHVADMMERLRAVVEAHPWYEIALSLRVTISIGVAHADGTQSFKSLVDRADEALYRAKQGGRNQVVVAR